MTFPVVFADSDHRLLSGTRQLYGCLWERNLLNQSFL